MVNDDIRLSTIHHRIAKASVGLFVCLFDGVTLLMDVTPVRGRERAASSSNIESLARRPLLFFGMTEREQESLIQ